jgi:plastocyanin
MKPYGVDRPPRWPLGSQVTTSNVDFYGVTVYWTAATDDTAVASYQVYENDSLLANIIAPALSYRATGLVPSDAYLFKVEASDTAGLSTSNGPSTVFSAPRELPAPQPPPSAEVIIRQSSLSTAFDPGTLTINQGQTVTWCNVGTLPVTVIFAGASYTVNPTYWSNGSWDPCIHLTFNDNGTFGYYDVYSGATGQIVVNPVPADFSLSANPSQVNSFSSASGRSTIAITRLGYFSGNITLRLSISPSGLTCSLSSQKIILKQSTIIGLSCTGPTRTYNVTIVGASETTTHYTSIVYSGGSSPGPGPQPSSGPQPRSTPPSASPTQIGSITLSMLRMIRSFFDRVAIWAGIGLGIAGLVTIAAIRRERRR